MLPGSHVEATARIVVARRCKQAGMHWRHHNAACVCAIPKKRDTESVPYVVTYFTMIDRPRSPIRTEPEPSIHSPPASALSCAAE